MQRRERDASSRRICVQRTAKVYVAETPSRHRKGIRSGDGRTGSQQFGSHQLRLCQITNTRPSKNGILMEARLQRFNRIFRVQLR